MNLLSIIRFNLIDSSKVSFMLRLAVFILMVCVGLASTADAKPAEARPASKKTTVHATNPANLYHRAFDAIAANHPQAAEDLIAQGTDPILNKVVTGYAMALPGNDYSFEQLNNFLNGNPGWPGLKAIQMIAEQKLPATMMPPQIMAWFTAHPPVTLVGFYHYIDALNQSGQAEVATSAIRTRWVEGNFTGDEQASFTSHFGTLLPAAIMWARMDHLLWKNSEAEARRMMPYVTATDQAVAAARLALASGDGAAESWLSRVPRDALNDAGLQFQKLRWLVKHNRDEDAFDMLQHPPAELGNPEAWWEQRQIMVRRAIARHDNRLAYELASNHGQSETKPLVQAEFLSGWLALRFLNQPALAQQHFQNVVENATTPITRARGAYWLGRTYEAMGDKNAAEQAYEDAAVFNTTYYGQLATTRLYANPVLTAKSDPPLPDSARRAFMGRDIMRAIVRLNDIGEPDRARSFFRAATEQATERAAFIVLTDIAVQMRRPDLGIAVVKAANQKDMQIANGGFPLLTTRPPTPPEAALTHALIKQESMFNPTAESPVGAKGLMQLMPRTARETARQSGLSYSENRLGEIDYNVRLGTAFAQKQIDHFNGSYVLALAGYNAGPGRVHEWLAQFGDPRDTSVDAIDWVELIPLQETRNYVQRIMENLQVYRAKLAGGQAPLLILNDLKR